MQPLFRNWHSAITQRQKNNFYVTGSNFDLNFLSYFWINSQNSCAYHVANLQNFLKLPQLLWFGWVEADKIAKNKVDPDFWDTLYVLKNNFYLEVHNQYACFRCTEENCWRRTSVREGSILSRSKLYLYQFILLVYSFLQLNWTLDQGNPNL